MKKLQAKANLQVGALPLRRNPAGTWEVLLVTTRSTKRWTVPKGWPIKKLKAHEAAAREALEEAGVAGSVKKKPVGRYLYWKYGSVVPAVQSPALSPARHTSTGELA